jgi:hypothetical protein
LFNHARKVFFASYQCPVIQKRWWKSSNGKAWKTRDE